MASSTSGDRQGIVFALITVGMWSTVATAFKWSLQVWTPLQLLTVAATASFCVLTFVILITGSARGLRELSCRQWLMHMALGMVNPVLYYLTLFVAYDRLPAQEAQAINYTWSLVLVALSVPILKHSLTRGDMLAALFGYMGVLVIATRGDPLSLSFHEPTGVFWALVSTVLWALYWLFATRQKVSPELGLWLHFLFGTLALWAIFALNEGWKGLSISTHWARGFLGGLYVGLFEMSVAFLCWQKAMRLVSRTALIGNLVYLSPLLSLILIHQVLDEPILPSTLGGLAFILGGIAVQRYQRSV